MQENKEITTKEKARLMKNAYQREWKRKNPDKAKAANERYFAKKYDLLVEQMMAELKKDPDANVDDETLKKFACNYIKHGITIDAIRSERGDTE